MLTQAIGELDALIGKLASYSKAVDANPNIKPHVKRRFCDELNLRVSALTTEMETLLKLSETDLAKLVTAK